MKATKKILSLLLVLAVIVAFGATAFAAGEGRITIDNAEKGVNYQLYRIFDATVSGTGNNTRVAYSINSDWADFFAAGAPGAAYLLTTNSGSLNAVQVGSQTRYVNITEANKAGFAKDAADWAIANANPVATQQLAANATGTELSFNNLDLGYYMIFPQGATYGNEHTTTDNNGNVTIVTLDTTALVANVHAKAGLNPDSPPDTPPLEKTSEDLKIKNGAVGDTVPFTISGEVPHTDGYTKFIYEITDKMTEGLTFTDADFRAMVISFGSHSVSFGSGNTISDGNSNSMAKATREKTSDGFKLTFDMTEYQDYAGETITITYNAKVNDKAVAKLTTNTAELRYSNNPRNVDNTVPAVPDNPPVVHVTTSKIVVDKYDASDSSKRTKLADAEFVLKNSAGKYYKFDTAANAVTWVDDVEDADVAKTNSEGVAEFIGLADGRYNLEETKAPAGFNRLTADTPVRVAAGSTATVGISQKAEVANRVGTVLPGTGGVGTTIFYVLGSCLLLGAAVLLVTRKRMGREG